jgi:hypothetical protein
MHPAKRADAVPGRCPNNFVFTNGVCGELMADHLRLIRDPTHAAAAALLPVSGQHRQQRWRRQHGEGNHNNTPLPCRMGACYNIQFLCSPLWFSWSVCGPQLGWAGWWRLAHGATLHLPCCMLLLMITWLQLSDL